MLKRLLVLLLPLLVVPALGCGSSSCARVCRKLASCKALSTDESTCTKDCEKPTLGRTCANEDAIASCIENASCDELTKETSQLKCPACQ
jgi:hypothetical protein